MGGGVAIRNCVSDLVATLCMSHKFISVPVLAKLHALWRAMLLCMEISLNQVIFEDDALFVVNDIDCQKEKCSWYGQMVEDITVVFKGRDDWHIQHIHREGNHVALQAAKLALQFEEERVWIEEGNDVIESFISYDTNCID